MILLLDMKNIDTLTEVLNLQLVSYAEEARLINYYDIPPLKDNVEKLMNCTETFLGYYIDNKLAGILSYKILDNILDIHRVAVHPDFFRRGIGDKLLNYVKDNYLTVTKLIVSTGKANIPAINLYVKNGFTFVKEVEIAPTLIITELEKVL